MTVGELRSLLKFVSDDVPFAVCVEVEAKGSKVRIVATTIDVAVRPAEEWGLGTAAALVFFATGQKVEMGALDDR